ncbi:MAG: PQQ-binding-like beta-propeller repeat protein [Polyangiaceae bacterium]
MYRSSHKKNRAVLVVTFNGRIAGVDRHDGRILWEYTLGHGLIEVVVDGDRCYAATMSRLHCLAYPGGTHLGSAALPGGYPRRPTMLIDGDQIFVATNGELACFSRDLQLRWFNPFPGRGLGSMALALPDNARQADDPGSD